MVKYINVKFFLIIKIYIADSVGVVMIDVSCQLDMIIVTKGDEMSSHFD